MNQPLLIDIEQVLQGKMGKHARFVPGFVVRYLKRIIHQDWLNDFILKEGSVQGVQWLEDCIRYLQLNITTEGLDLLPSATDGRRYTFVSNHPLGGADGIVLGAVLGRHYNGHIRYLANDLLMFLSGIASLIVPINKTGKQGRDFPRRVNEAFAGQDQIIMFPAGICSRRIDGKIQDLPWAKSFITKSVEYQRDVIPIFFEGRNSDFFYNLATWAKRLSIPFNPAMIYLVDELYKHRSGSFRVRIGHPIPYTTFDGSLTPIAWAQKVRHQVYALGSR